MSRCRECGAPIDLTKAHYQDSLGRWEFCCWCYVHRPHPAGETLAWWYAAERLLEIRNEHVPT